ALGEPAGDSGGEGFPPEAADDYCNVTSGGHGTTLGEPRGLRNSTRPGDDQGRRLTAAAPRRGGPRRGGGRQGQSLELDAQRGVEVVHPVRRRTVVGWQRSPAEVDGAHHD